MSAKARARNAGVGAPARLKRSRFASTRSRFEIPGNVVQCRWDSAIGHVDDGSAQLAQVGDGVDLYQPSGSQYRNSVAHRLDLGELMGTQEDRSGHAPSPRRHNGETRAPSEDLGRSWVRRARAEAREWRTRRPGRPSAGCRWNTPSRACRGRAENDQRVRCGSRCRRSGRHCRAVLGFRHRSTPATVRHRQARMPGIGGQCRHRLRRCRISGRHRCWGE